MCVFFCVILLHHVMGCFIINIDWNRSRFQLANFSVRISALTGNLRNNRGSFCVWCHFKATKNNIVDKKKTCNPSDSAKKHVPFILGMMNNIKKNVTEIPLVVKGYSPRFFGIKLGRFDGRKITWMFVFQRVVHGVLLSSFQIGSMMGFPKKHEQ